MKLIRYDNPGSEKTGVIIEDILYDTSALGEDYNELFFETDDLDCLETFLKTNAGKLSTINSSERISSPIAWPSKILCLGLNYDKYARETSATIPLEPILFMKSTIAMVSPFNDIIIPIGFVKTNWEMELTIVIGKKASYVEDPYALDYIAGYLLHNDVSERKFHIERNGTLDKGKGCDTFATVCPFLATADEIADVHNLRLWLTLNSKMMQDSSTSDLIFNIPFLISYISRFMTLLPGDVISKGSPTGVGLGFNPPVYLKDGDMIELGIDGLGTARQAVKKVC